MNIEDDILIERFFKKELSENEKISFLKRLKVDNDFKEYFLIEKQLWQTLNDKEWSFIENTNAKDVKEYEELFKSIEIKKIKESINVANKKYKNSKNLKRFIYSSAAVLVLFFSIFMLDLSKEKSVEELYTFHIEQESLPTLANRGNDVQYEKLIKAQEFFEKKEYKKSIAIFSEELKTKNESSVVYLYIAIAQIETNQFSEAEITLDNLINSDFIDAQKGYWLKSLLYLKSNNLDKSKEELQKIINNSFYKKEEAKILLQQIQNLNK